MNLFTIQAGVPFLETLAAWWLARSDDPLRCADGQFLVPTRRAARALTETFLAAAEGRPLLLPRIAAIGALDEAPLALAGALDLPPAVGDAERLAALTRLVMALEGRHGAPATADRAWLLAAELARLLDEAHREGVDLAEALPRLVAADYAAHWADTLTFLQIVTAHWPGFLAAAGKIDAAARGVRLLGAQAAAWQRTPPDHPIVVAGMPGGNRATGELMRVVARLPLGAVVLPDVDRDMPDEHWEQLEDSHKQAGLRRLLGFLGATRGDVMPFPHTLASGSDPLAGRRALVRRALLPARALGAWREPFAADVQGLQRLEAADQQEEAVAIALVLREALQTRHTRAALVTPDRALAARVAAELARFGVVVDDSAGEPLAETPPGAFLRLLARAVAEGFAPVALLSVLKHPLAAFGLRPAECRARARWLERRVLRGPAPPPGMAGLRAAVLAKPNADDLAAFVDRIEACLAPLLALAGAGPMAPDGAPNGAPNGALGAASNVAPDVALRALIEAGEAAASTAEQPGAARLWALEEGEALAVHLAALVAALPLIPPQPLRTLPGLLDASLQGAVVRTRRALRGRDGAEHPRVAILGLLEARLQSFDVVVLGSLAEAVWPPAADPGPWMSRPMRRDAGLASPEQGVGQMAHDFAQLASAAPQVVLSCPRRRDGAPAVPARWLVRLEAFLAGHGTALPRSPAADWARQLDHALGPPKPVRPPQPRPPVANRPRQLGVTEVETWLRDPYGLYARHVLGLKALEPLEQAVENADFGNLVHGAIAAWVRTLPAPYPADAAARLRAAMAVALEGRPLRPALVAWWRPRLLRIADWVAAREADRQMARAAAVSVEVKGAWALPGLDFTLNARADRIERRPDGRLAVLDYKTGVVPTGKAVEAGYAPQLPLEAAMAAAGGFGDELRGEAAELTYWRLTGGYVPGEETTLFKGSPDATAAQAAEAGARFAELVARFDDPEQPYLSQPHPGAAPRFTDYAQLARVAEWSAAGDE